MPHMDEGGFVLDFLSPPGTSLAETDRLVNLIEGILKANPAVETYSKRTGGGLGGSLHESNEGDFFVRLKPMPRPPIDQVMDEIRAEIEQKVPGLEIDLVLLMEDLIGDLTAVPQPIEVKLYGDNFDELMTVAPKVAGAIKGITGVVDVKDGIVLAGDALAIRLDRKKAALEGVDPANVTEQLQAWLSGVVTTQVQEGVKLVGVRVWTPSLVRRSAADIEKIQLRAPDGHLFPLKRIADIDTIIGQPQITRENLKRMIAVTGRISGRDMGSTIRDVKQTLAQQGLLPKTVYYELGGLYKQQQIAFRGLIAVFAAALGLVFLLLLFLYEEFAAAAAILAMPLAGHGNGVHRPVDYRYRAEHHRYDGHDHDCRYRDRGVDFLLLRIPRFGAPWSRQGSGAGPGRGQPLAPDYHDDARGHFSTAAVGTRHGAGFTDATTLGRGHHFRSVGADTACHYGVAAGLQNPGAYQGCINAQNELNAHGHNSLILSCVHIGVARVAASHAEVGADLSGSRHRRCRRHCND